MSEPSSSWTPTIHNAVAAQDLIELRDLLDQFVNSTDINGRTALHSAIIKQFDSGANFLLDRGADPGIKDKNGNTALHYACSVLKSNDIIAEKILENYFNVDSKNQEGNVALHFACLKASDKTVDKILKNGGSVTVRNNEGDTPLHSVAKTTTDSYVDSYGESNFKEFIPRKEAISLQLLEKGANLQACNKLGNTPLHCVASSGNKASIQVLLDNGASLEKRNANGDSPLHVAVKRLNKTAAQVLLENGANVHAKDKNGMTLLHYMVNEDTEHHGGGIFRPIINELLIWGGSLLTPYKDGKTLLDTISEPPSLLTKPVVDYVIALKKTKSNWKQYENFEKVVPFDKYIPPCAFDPLIIRMKEMKFGHHTLFDVFLKWENPTFVLNSDLEKAVKDSSFDIGYVNFGSLLRAAFKKAKLRFKMMVKSHCKLTNELPNEIVWQVLTYLEDDDLKNVIKAIEG